MNSKGESSAYTTGLRSVLNWQRGNPLPRPDDDLYEREIRQWVRGWNAGVASRSLLTNQRNAVDINVQQHCDR